MNKKKALKINARRRFQERHGLQFTKEMEDEIKHKIRTNTDATFIRSISNARKEWEVSIDGKIIRIIYDRNRKQIVTALPSNENNNN